MYEYKARIIDVVDGDTVDVLIDLGLDTFSAQRVRLYGIDAPEKSSEQGIAAKDRLTKLLPFGTDVVLRTVKDKKEKYGRYLGVFVTGEVEVNSLMIAEQHAIPYFGSKRVQE